MGTKRQILNAAYQGDSIKLRQLLTERRDRGGARTRTIASEVPAHAAASDTPETLEVLKDFGWHPGRYREPAHHPMVWALNARALRTATALLNDYAVDIPDEAAVNGLVKAAIASDLLTVQWIYDAKALHRSAHDEADNRLTEGGLESERRWLNDTVGVIAMRRALCEPEGVAQHREDSPDSSPGPGIGL